MSADRELLELAAKAAGSEIWTDADGNIYTGEPERLWNPLTDDGDALRLAVKLGIGIYLEGTGDDAAVWSDDVMLWTDGDAPAATRRAIVMAAAKRAGSLP